MTDGPRGAIHIGCAGWSLPRAAHEQFPQQGSHLQRYAARLPAVEINSSFYRSHRPATYARWAASVPDTFRFSVKVPRTITHEGMLADAETKLDTFLSEASALGGKLGCLLVQLPSSLPFDQAIAARFFAALRERHAGATVLEPRHSSWAAPECDALLEIFHIGRVAADPPRIPLGGEPRGWRGVIYYRLHGMPRVYFSAYSDAYLDTLAASLAVHRKDSTALWCIFDNTGLGAAPINAAGLLDRLAVR
ncbi:MAG: DUF72 domain-containing protein [Pseudomonadota bacterium]|nr:DUF72 domain-containing protein [Pseudomonadota bacterium]